MKIVLSSESTIDLPKELLEKYQIKIIPYTIVMGEENGLDGEITPQDIFDFTAKTGKLAHTAAINQVQYEDHFRELLKEGDAIIHFGLSSEITSAYQNAVNAAREIAEDKIFIVDSRSLSTGIALEAIYARRLIDANKEPKEIVELVKKRIPHVQASFAVESVDYLYKGGRCSAMAAFGANILKIRPQILLKDGKMVSGKKFRGPMKKWVKDYSEATLEEFNNPDLELVFVTYSSADQEAVDWAVNRLKERGFRTIYTTKAGGTITCHCGPNTLGILYINDGEHPIE
ncbi:MAG: DegV family protein [Bacilli bacterium]|nr:DegV family protein [Bacilli bacterium]